MILLSPIQKKKASSSEGFVILKCVVDGASDANMNQERKERTSELIHIAPLNEKGETHDVIRVEVEIGLLKHSQATPALSPTQPTEQLLKAEVKHVGEAEVSILCDDYVSGEFDSIRKEGASDINGGITQDQRKEGTESDEEIQFKFQRKKGVAKYKPFRVKNIHKVSVSLKTNVSSNASNTANNFPEEIERNVQVQPRSWSKVPLPFEGEDDYCRISCRTAKRNNNDAYEDMLNFFSRAHHDQDEAYLDRALQEQAKKTEHALEMLNASVEKAKQQLNNMLSQKWSTETEVFQKRAKEKHITMMKKQKFQRAQLTLTQEKRLEGFTSKIQERINHLTSTMTMPTPDANMETQQKLRYWQKYEQDERQKLQQRFQDQLQMLRTHHSMRQEELLLEFTEEKARIKAARQQQLQYHLNYFLLKAEKQKRKVLQKFELNRYYLHDLEDHKEGSPSLQQQVCLTSHQSAVEELSATAEASKAAISTVSPSHTSDLFEIPFNTNFLVSEDNNVSSHNAANLLKERPLIKSSLDTSSETKNDTKNSSTKSSFTPDGFRTAGRSAGSASFSRQNMRKTVTKSGIPVQLAIDLHNEGIVIHYRSTGDKSNEETIGCNIDEIIDAPSASVLVEGQQSALSIDTVVDSICGKSSENKLDTENIDKGMSSSERKTGTIVGEKKGREDSLQVGGRLPTGYIGGKSEFIAWGVRARQLLHSVFRGEVPSNFSGDEFDEKGALPGGLIKCMVTDMRTSDETAIAQRSEAQRSLLAHSSDELKVGFKKNDCTGNKANIDAPVLEKQQRGTTYRSENERANAAYEKSMLKASQYYQLDGHTSQNQLVPTETIIRANDRCASADDVKDEKADDLPPKKEKKQLEIVTEDQPNSERIAKVFSVIRATMEQRRLQLDKKRVEYKPLDFRQASSLCKEMALKVSFRQKMEHRRLVIVLRPNANGMQSEAKRIASECMKRATLNASIDERTAFLRVEQLLLLALHPVAPEEGLSTIPLVTESKPWGESGWQLELKVDRLNPSSLSTKNYLPTLHLPSTFRNSLADCTSAPGRQSSALFPARFFRVLAAPLSKLCQASAPAEPHNMVLFEHAQLGFDPFQTNGKDMTMGYQFATQLSLTVPPSSNRSKRPISKEEGTKNKRSTSKKSRSASSRKPGKDDAPTPGKAFSSARSEDSTAVDRPNSRRSKPSRTLQQSPPVIGNINRSSPLMSNEASISQTVPQTTVAEQPQKAQRQRATQSLYNSQNISFTVEPMQPHHQPQSQQQQQQQQHHQAEFLRRFSNTSQSTIPLSSRTVQSMSLISPTIVQTTPQHISQYFHHPQQPQTQQQPAVSTGQQVRQQQLLQQQQQRQIAQIQRVIQTPSQSIGQPYPFSGQSTYGQPPTFSHVSHVASTAQMVMPPMQSQPMNNTFGLQYPPQEQASQGQLRSRNAEEDYDPLFMLLNQ